MAQPKASHWRAWSRAYGVDKRQARRMRRKFAKTGERQCQASWFCVLRGERVHSVHYSPEFGPFVGNDPSYRKAP